MRDLDSAIENLEAWEAKEKGNAEPTMVSNRVLIGRVEQFFEKIGVMAITLESDLKVGDIIEIGNYEEAVRQKISSMQIDKKDVAEAGRGNDVGIKLKYRVSAGSEVYRIGR
ncbi:MAG: hypothetical protein M1569_01900 [Candidatus Marsarchaeota archaeon]|nr:hypothetical protein [Candidatus Marsarchaeota archaeon]MCL5413134.1 hypothetical protein [Candidatus Marsarchaeota archaeon]